MTPIQTDIVMVSLAASSDYASTKYALKNCSGCYEFNPIARNDFVQISTKAAGIALSTIAANKLRKRGHKTWAKAVRYIAMGIYLGIAANNVRLGYEYRNDEANRK